MLSLDSSWNRFTKDQADRLTSLPTQAEQAKKRQRDTKQRLQEAQDAVTTAQAQYGAVYNEGAAILRLPNELIVLVVKFAMQRTVEEARYLRAEESCRSRQECEAYESSIRRRAEITMSHTCQRIRSVLLDCPEVWTSITLVAGLNEVVPLDHLEEYLKRSGNRLLDIWLDFRHESYPPLKGVALEHPREILHALLPHAGRWRRFTVLSSNQTPLHSALSYIECLSAPYLEHFAACLGHCVAYILPPVLQGGAPKLTSFWTDVKVIPIHPLFSNLSTLRLEWSGAYIRDESDRYSWPEFMSVLQLPALTDLSLSNEPFTWSQADHVTVSIPSLRNLRANQSEVLSVDVDAPLLEALQVHNIVITEMPPNPIRSFPSLRYLTLTGCDVLSESALLSFAARTQHITELTLTESIGDHPSILLSPPPPVDFLGSYTSLEDSATPHWQHIQVLTINQEIQGAPEQFTKFAKEPHANSRMKLRIHSSIVAMWTAESQKQLRELRSVIDIEECDDYTLLPRYWPPGDGVAISFFVDVGDPFSAPVHRSDEELWQWDESEECSDGDGSGDQGSETGNGESSSEQ